MVAPRGRDHGQPHAHPRAGLDPPRAVGVAPDVRGVVDALVGALDGEAVIGGGELQVVGRVLIPTR